MAKWIEWIEPFGPNNEPVYMRVAPATAVAYMREAYQQLSEPDAIEEFKAVHWATEVEENVQTTITS